MPLNQVTLMTCCLLAPIPIIGQLLENVSFPCFLWRIMAGNTRIIANQSPACVCSSQGQSTYQSISWLKPSRHLSKAGVYSQHLCKMDGLLKGSLQLLTDYQLSTLSGGIYFANHKLVHGACVMNGTIASCIIAYFSSAIRGSGSQLS